MVQNELHFVFLSMLSSYAIYVFDAPRDAVYY